MRSHRRESSHCVAFSRLIQRRSNMQQLLILPVLLASFCTVCAGAGGWCYYSQSTCDHPCSVPEKWPGGYMDCGGKSQSPINIVTRKTVKDERLTPIEFKNYQQTFKNSITNNGHSVKVNIPITCTISGGDLSTTYKAVQFHLHWGKDGGPGSEHTVDGEQYPMELHIVHMKSNYADLTTALRDPNGVAVLGFFYEVSKSPNRMYDTIINGVESVASKNVSFSLPSISLAQLIPPEQKLTSYYRYKGSLTTPPCSESVVWTVFETPIPLSMDQMKAFSKVQFYDGKSMSNNFRPLQPLNGRLVYRSAGAALWVSSALLAAALTTALGLSQPN
ncbi:PREDICTED: carbonic anhydrase 4-like [Poecilia mexicana]|uniref:Carbonic anhydrase n=1 Tax=Poecilia mexicana TaxID=48701 RepID=A0A3B3YJM0_9TELE|nr:PREDICTED: carbonic anhydrase 4-like [Poecilia mexicana]